LSNENLQLPNKASLCRLSFFACRHDRTIFREDLSALLLRELSRLCVEASPANEADHIDLFNRACDIAHKKLGIDAEDLSMAAIFNPPLKRDPVLVRLDTWMAPFRLAKAAEFLTWYEEAGPEGKLVAALSAMTDELRERLLKELEHDFPEHRRIQVIGFFCRYGGMKDKPWDKPEEFLKDCERVRKLDPENGLLLLVPLRALKPDEDSVDYQPLTDKELRLVERSLAMPRFETYEGHGLAEATRWYGDAYGPFIGWSDMKSGHFWPSGIREITGRVTATIRLRFDEGRPDAAREVYAAGLSLIEKYKSGTADTSFRRLKSLSFTSSICDLVLNYSEHVDRNVLNDALEKMADKHRRKLASWEVSRDAVTMQSMPIMKLAATACSFWVQPEGFFQELFRRMLREEPKEHLVRSLKKLRETLDRDNPAYPPLILVFDYRAAITLGDLLALGLTDDPAALEVMGRLAEHRDPLLRHIAAEALAKTVRPE